MSYASRAQIQARVPALQFALSDFDATAVEALAWADARIDSGLVGVYPMPFSSAPSAVSQLAADYATVFVLRSTGDPEAAKRADRLEAECDARLAAWAKSGIPGLDPTAPLSPAQDLAYHTGLGETSSLELSLIHI